MVGGYSAGPGGDAPVVKPDELFFSTTDRRGLIRTGNSVFVRISGFPLEDLTGAPHSIVRHPDMPAGVFRLLWDRLLSGRPAGVYVQNLTKDGESYWVFATVTPLGDGFLSVRVAPQGPLFEAAKQIYRQTLAVEQQARAEGLNRRETAEAGLKHLQRTLGTLGFGSHDEFLAEALSFEVGVRRRLASTGYARPHGHGPTAEVLRTAGALEGQLGELVERLESYRTLCDRLSHASSRVLEVARRLNKAVGAAQYASETVVATAPVLKNVARVMAQPMDRAVGALEELVPRLARLGSLVADLRFRIALAHLHNDMVAAFAAEVVDGLAPHTSLSEVPLLCDALHDGVLEMSERARQVNHELHDVATLVAEAGLRLEEFRKFLGQWRTLVSRRGAGPALGRLLEPIDDEFVAGWEGLEMLRELGRQFQASVLPLDPAVLETWLDRMRDAAAASREEP
ncbi:PAS domain-containing protein [Amycolatopsis cynarae]|uniref:PAS domain-containing protein n=1 Tax=Amycolatopsis cynarae TaxID=2995223 RepID=A0ABY7B7G6_9PSEU|nr:PAS domain-containing protein [Amycolatopsis sp. HUAS 11-8]WAL68276.1 PAS domain-containing protein [Amycolatopsis sp. HUAS 11-8]